MLLTSYSTCNNSNLPNVVDQKMSQKAMGYPVKTSDRIVS